MLRTFRSAETLSRNVSRCLGPVPLCQVWRYKPPEKNPRKFDKSLLSPSPRENAAFLKRTSTVMSPLLPRYVPEVFDWCITNSKCHSKFFTLCMRVKSQKDACFWLAYFLLLIGYFLLSAFRWLDKNKKFKNYCFFVRKWMKIWLAVQQRKLKLVSVKWDESFHRFISWRCFAMRNFHRTTHFTGEFSVLWNWPFFIFFVVVVVLHSPSRLHGTHNISFVWTKNQKFAFTLMIKNSRKFLNEPLGLVPLHPWHADSKNVISHLFTIQNLCLWSLFLFVVWTIFIHKYGKCFCPFLDRHWNLPSNTENVLRSRTKVNLWQTPANCFLKKTKLL